MVCSRTSGGLAGLTDLEDMSRTEACRHIVVAYVHARRVQCPVVRQTYRSREPSVLNPADDQHRAITSSLVAHSDVRKHNKSSMTHTDPCSLRRQATHA